MNRKNVRRILRTMQYNPQWLVRRARWYEHSRVRLSGHRLYRWIKRYEHRPLSMLGECYGKTCPNSRLKYPEKREQFVHDAVRLVQQTWEASLEELHCIMLGSGSLLQEAIFLSHLCETVDIKHMHVTLCDEEYAVKNQDESRILTARFKQLEAWMTHVAPQTSWSWHTAHAWESTKFDTQQPTILCAADMEISDELWKGINATAHSTLHKPFVAIVLDNHGIIHRIKSD